MSESCLGSCGSEKQIKFVLTLLKIIYGWHLMKKNTKALIDKLGLDSDQYSQCETIELIKNPFKSAWTTVYDYSNLTNSSTVIFSCFANPVSENVILSESDWTKQPEDFLPAFVTTGNKTEYEPSNSDGYEFIVTRQDFPTLDGSELILNQEFVLLLNLYRSPEGNYCTLDESGNMEEAVRFSQGKVEIRTKCLISYMAARQFLYVQFIDSRVDSAEQFAWDSKVIESESVQGSNFNYSITYQSDSRQSFLFSMIHAQSIMRPKPMEECGISPFEQKDDYYPDFIINEKPDGTSERFTCDESKLSNRFGSNPNAPDYLTPVFFKSEVLDKYRKKPEAFTVTERSLECGHQWAVPIDNLNPRRVMVYLGDLGAKLPANERRHFLDYEMSPVGQSISEEVYRNDILGQWTEPTGTISKFDLAYHNLCEEWKHSFGFDLFQKHHPKDGDILGKIHIPTSNNVEEFNSIILNTAKLLIEYINEQALNINKTGSLNKLEEFLGQRNISADLSSLRDLQDLRSTGTAHAKGKKFDRISKALLTGDTVADTKTLIDRLTNCMNLLTEQLTDQEHLTKETQN